MNKNTDYRKLYKKYYDIDFDKDFVIHHIDLNRKNNNIDNLLLLPRDLHTKYHMILNALSICPEKPKADGIIDFRLSNALVTNYSLTILEKLYETINECNKWLQFKRYNYDEYLQGFIFVDKKGKKKNG